MSMKKMLAVVAAASLVAVAVPAFAANPFSDVPMNHWAYDAVEQMAAKGILEGYPNGTFKGNRAMTRYEIAQMVARMMANGVGGADADKLKALIVEFAPELEAIGVKVDGFDGRLSALEKGVGGWTLSGQMRFDVFSHKDLPKDATGEANPAGWSGRGAQFNRARIFLHKDMSDGVSFDARYHDGTFDRYWVTAKNFLGAQGLTAKIGQYGFDLEGRDGLYKNNNWQDDDSFFFDTTARGVLLNYNRGGFEAEFQYASNVGGYGKEGVYKANDGREVYPGRLAYSGEKFHVSANGAWFNEPGLYGMNWKMYYFALGFKPVRGIELIGAYFMEKDIEHDPKAWKIVLDVDQDLLKFTSLRFEYADLDKGFFLNNVGPLTWHAKMSHNVTSGYLAEDTKLFKVEALQKWGAKFQTYERWGQYKQSDNGKAKELQLGIGYQYTPNLWFGVDYTKCDGLLYDGGKVYSDMKDKVIRFRTVLNF